MKGEEEGKKKRRERRKKESVPLDEEGEKLGGRGREREKKDRIIFN